ncbi:MAG: hypothetical protein WCA63_11600, partial [Gallionella sp.]
IKEATNKYPELIAYGRYALQLEPYLGTFGRDAVLPVFFDRLLCEPQAELERICQFIGYQGQATWVEDMKPDNVSSERIRKFPLYDLLVDSGPAMWFRHHFIPQRFRDAVKTRLHMRQRPSLGEEDRARLEVEFDRDLAQLGRWLGTRIDCKNFKQVTSKGTLNWIL